MRNVINLLSVGVKLVPNLVTRVEEHLEKNVGRLTHFPVNTATWCIFARDCMWASLQMSRSVETCITGCQNSAFSNAQDMPNFLTGSLFENEQSEEPVLLRDEGQFSCEGLHR